MVLLRRGLLIAAVIVRCSAAFTRADHFHFVGDDVVSRAFDAVFAGVFAALNAAFDIHFTPFFQILAGDFGQAAIHGDVVPLGALLALAVAVVPRFAGGDAEITHGLAVGHITHFGVAAEAAEQNHFVH